MLYARLFFILWAFVARKCLTFYVTPLWPNIKKWQCTILLSILILLHVFFFYNVFAKVYWYLYQHQELVMMILCFSLRVSYWSYMKFLRPPSFLMLAVNSNPVLYLRCTSTQCKQRVTYLKCSILLIHYILHVYNSISGWAFLGNGNIE